jgi:hypothetical protein
MSIVRRCSAQRAARRIVYCAFAAAFVGMPSMASAQDAFSLKTTVTISGVALSSFDISWFDPEVRAYLLSDRSNKAIDVIDAATKAQRQLQVGQFAGAVTDYPGTATACPPNSCNGPNGNLSFFNRRSGSHEVWAGDGPRAGCTGRQPLGTQTTACSTVKVIDFSTGTLVHNIPTGGQYRADELCYDPVDHLIQIANDSDLPFPYINFIPTEGPNAYTVVKQITFDGLPGDGPAATNGIEQCQWNPRDGMIYLNVPEVSGDGNDDAPGHTVIIDPKTMTIVRHFVIPLDKCAGPQGMAIGPAPEILLGCNAKGPPETPTGCTTSSTCTGSGPQNTVVIDERDGHVIRTLDNQGGNDEVWFNPDNGLYFLAEGQNALHVQLGIVDSQPIFVTQDIDVAIPAGTGHAHSVAAGGDEVYFPVPSNVCTGATTCLSPCPTANGCIAVYKSSSPPPHFVYRPQD